MIRRRSGRRGHERRPARFVCPRSTCARMIDGAAAATAGACPHCGSPIDAAAGGLRSLVVPVVGAPGAGKTRLVGAIARHLTAGPDPLARVGGGEADRLSVIGRAVAAGAAIAPTPLEHSQAFELIVDEAGVGVDLQLHDLAGRRIRTDAHLDQLRCLTAAEGFLVVIDPTAVPSIGAQVAPGHRSVAPTGGDLLTDISLMLVRLGDVERRGRAAVVITKADLLIGTDAGRGLMAAVAAGQVVEWLGELDQSALVRVLQSTFEEVAWFASTAVGGPALDVGPPTAPALWLLGRGRADQVPSGRLPRGPDHRVPVGTGVAGPPVATSASPACLVVIVDQSGAMAAPVPGGSEGERLGDRAAATIDGLLHELVILVDGTPARAGAIEVAVIGHSDGARPVLGGPLAGRDLVAVDELRSAARWVGAEPPATLPRPTWIEPIAVGGAGRDEALAQVRAMIDRWRRLHPDAPAPIVVEVVGPGDDGATVIDRVPIRRIVVGDGGWSHDELSSSLVSELGIW